MLLSLHIRNFAIVEELTLDFAKGMTAITGETGAGKSILIDALSLALGDRANSDVVRHGTERAEITLHFDISNVPHIKNSLSKYELDADNDCILRRTINAEGGSKAYINGSPVPIQKLKELGKKLIDIHGQHAHHSLLEADMQAILFDQFSDALTERKELATCFQKLKTLKLEQEELNKQEKENTDRIDYLNYQLEEIKNLAPKNNEWEELISEQKKLTDTEILSNEGHKVLEMLSDEVGCLSILNNCQQVLTKLKRLNKVESIVTLLDQAEVNLQEAFTDLKHLLEKTELNDEQLKDVEKRMSAFHEIARKHRIAPHELPNLQEKICQELQEITKQESRKHKLSEEIDILQKEYNSLATILSNKRHKNLIRFNDTITEYMQNLGLSDGKFVATLKIRSNHILNKDGFEQINFLVITNPGNPEKELQKIASGGELSRLSLAIAIANLNSNFKPLLVFDEVDVGIGGLTADVVGSYLHNLGKKAQVVCVTHLAQVAAHADNHCRIQKITKSGKTFGTVISLHGEERISELARMLGGSYISKQTIKHAEEMLAKRQLPA